MNQVLNFAANFKITDVLDVLVVAIIIYKFLQMIRGTRAVQILLGTGTLFLLYWLSSSFDLYSLNWILSNFFDNFFLILIILFQDNIRNVLASVGGVRLFGKMGHSEMDTIIEEVVEAAWAMGREKTGAIIVFENSNGLLNFISSGTKLDSNIHSDVLYSIFQKNSPLHDGAVILSGGRLAAAGCYLPLSKNVEIDRHYGTRHRAALGITELTDAVVVTVSEETGKVNLCFKHQFYPMKDEYSLKMYLKRLLIYDSSKSSLADSMETKV